MNIVQAPQPMQNYLMAMRPASGGGQSFSPSNGDFKYIKSGSTKRSLGAWVYVPANVCPDSLPLVAVHGISRRAKEQVQMFADAADRTGRIVIAPLFGRRHWRHYQRISNNYRSDRALLDLLSRIEMQGIAGLRKFDLFGYSGGAQFAHRFAMLFPQRIGKLNLAAAGCYCMPDLNTVYPYGLAARPGRKSDWGPRMMAGLDSYLRLPISVFVGANDTVADPAFRRSPELDVNQGTNRLMRAKRYHAVLSELAHLRVIRSRISISLLPNSSHSFSQCVKSGGLDRLVLG